jgi:hypothetical protein
MTAISPLTQLFEILYTALVPRELIHLRRAGLAMLLE